MINRLTQGLDFHAQALSLRAERQRLLSSNIANAETPGFVARDFNFADAMRDVQARQAGQGVPALLSQQGPDGVSPSLLYARPSMTSADGSTVDMDRERASFIDNTVKYEATLRFINANVRTTLDAMKTPQQG